MNRKEMNMNSSDMIFIVWISDRLECKTYEVWYMEIVEWNKMPRAEWQKTIAFYLHRALSI